MISFHWHRNRSMHFYFNNNFGPPMIIVTIIVTIIIGGWNYCVAHFPKLFFQNMLFLSIKHKFEILHNFLINHFLVFNCPILYLVIEREIERSSVGLPLLKSPKIKFNFHKEFWPKNWKSSCNYPKTAPKTNPFLGILHADPVMDCI